MAVRRRNSALDFIQSFNAAFDTVNKVGQNLETAKVANATPEFEGGFSEDQGKEITAAAESGQNHIGYDEAAKAYVANPEEYDFKKILNW